MHEDVKILHGAALPDFHAAARCLGHSPRQGARSMRETLVLHFL